MASLVSERLRWCGFEQDGLDFHDVGKSELVAGRLGLKL